MSKIVFSIDKFDQLLDNYQSEMINAINVYQSALHSLTDANGSNYTDLSIKDISEYFAKESLNNPNNIIKYLSDFVLSIIIYKTIKNHSENHSENTENIKTIISSSWNKLVDLLNLFELDNSSLELP